MAKFNVEEVSPIERRINVEVEPEVVQLQLEQAYKALSHRVRVPGFRPGKVPRRILEARFKDQVESDVIQHLVEHSYLEAIRANPAVSPVAPPRVSNQGLKLGEAFRYQAHVPVKPKIDPKDYEGLEFKPAARGVEDQKVAEELERLRQAMSELTPVEGRDAAQTGDYAVIDYQGTVDGKGFPGGKGEGATFEVSDGDFSNGHAPQVAGMKIGEAKEFDYAFAKDHRLAELAGKTAHFKVALKSLKSKKVPELNDELAKDAGAGQTLDELKKKIRSELEERAREAGDREEREQLMKQLLAKNPFEIPPEMVEAAADSMLEDWLQGLQRQGIDPRRMKLDFERMREGLREPATAGVKGALLLEAIAAKEKIEVGDEDLDKEISEMAVRIGLPKEKLKPQIRGDAERSLKQRVKDQKTLAFLKSKAKIQAS
jgi:trigger factor